MKRYFKILALGVAVLCIFILGAGFGYMKATDRLNKLYFDSYSSLAATEVEYQVHLLELLKDGDSDKAQKRLEALLDVSLGGLVTYVNNPPSKQNNDVVEAMKIAKKYRGKYPEHRINPNIENSVKKTLDFVKDK